MKRVALLAVPFTVVLATVLVVGASPAIDDAWPQWRGPLGSGVAPAADPPLTWSEQENVRWKAAIPGRGHGAPIVWGDKVFVQTAVPVEQESAAPPVAEEGRRRRGVTPGGPVRWTVMALDRVTGAVAWERVAREETPHEGTHADGSWASASAATDGDVLIAHFGSQGLYAYDLAGVLLWSKDLGDMTTRHSFGEGSSPTLAGNTLVVNWDHEGESFIVALDKNDGRELWRRERDEVTSWATPLVVEHDGRLQVVVSATGRVRSYDLATGDVVWEAGGQTVNVIPSPVHRDGLVYAMSGFRGSTLQAIRLAGAQGDVTDSEAVVWSHERAQSGCRTGFVATAERHGGLECIGIHEPRDPYLVETPLDKAVGRMLVVFQSAG